MQCVRFLNELNKFHRNLGFAYETSNKSVNFLDLNVSLGNSAISADLYVKPTDGQQLLKNILSRTYKKFDTI